MNKYGVMFGLVLAGCSGGGGASLTTLEQQSVEEQAAQRSDVLTAFARSMPDLGVLSHCQSAGLWIDHRGDVRWDTMGHPHHDGLFEEMCEEYLSPEEMDCAGDEVTREGIECCLVGTPLEVPEHADLACPPEE